MSYQVLARKWRPRNFSELAGQSHVVQALTNALTQKRLHHAYLLTGTRGVGKTTIARILAKSLNCETGVTATPCGVCSACVAVDEGRFVDLVELDAASSTGVDNMREILETARYAPTSGRYKVYLIDEVHQLSKGAFNSMLKTLEEPPEHVKFVLATTDPQKIPITVLSRCLQFNLKQLPPPIVAQQLEHVLGEEKIPYEPGAIRLLSRAAQGSMRDGLSLLDQAIAYGAGGVEEAQVRQMLGAVETDHVLRLLEALSAHDGRALFDEVRAMAERNLALDTALQDLGVALHDIALLQTVPEAIGDDHPERDRLVALAQSLDPETVQLYYQIAVQGRTDLPLAPDEFAGFSMTLLRMLAFSPTAGGGAERAVPSGAAKASPPKMAGARPASAAQPDAPRRAESRAEARAEFRSEPRAEPRAEVRGEQRAEPRAEVRGGPRGEPRAEVRSEQRAESRPEMRPGPPPAKTDVPIRSELSAAAMTSDLLAAVSNAAQPPAAVDPGAIADADRRVADWFAWVAGSGLTGLAHQLAYNAELKSHPVTATGVEVDLALADNQRHLAEKMHQEKLKDALANTLGVTVRLSIEIGGAGESSVAAADRRAKAQLQDEATASFNADPFVRDALRLFEGRVRPQTIQPVAGSARSEGNKQ